MIERDEFLKMALEAGFECNESRTAINALGKSVPVVWVESFANAILERAALECDDQWSKQDEFDGKQAVDCCSNAVRALKTKE